MKTYEYGKSDTVLIQPVGKHELTWIENEVREIHRLTSADFKYIAVEIADWNNELSPVLMEEQLKRWRKYWRFVQIKRNTILAVILWQGCFPYGQHTKQICLQESLLYLRLSGFLDLLII